MARLQPPSAYATEVNCVSVIDADPYALTSE